jgi:DNA-directed RNA polymerase subunit RPC12/RpoP
MREFICHTCGKRNDYNNIGYEDRDTIRCKKCVREREEQLVEYKKAGMSLAEIMLAGLKK